MATKKDTEIYYTLTQIQKTYRIPLNKIKETLIKNNICDLDGLRAIPKDEFIKDGRALEIESNYGDYPVYYKFQKALVKTIFDVKLPAELNPMTWREAVKWLTNFSEKLQKINKGKYPYYFHMIEGFEHEVENYIKTLVDLKSKFTKDEQKIIDANLSYLLRSKRSPYDLDFLKQNNY